MEDLFRVSSGSLEEHDLRWRRSVSLGLDGKGHLGFAAQPDLRTFGSDVFNNVHQARALVGMENIH